MKEHTHPDYQDDLENVSEQDASTTAAIDTTELLPHLNLLQQTP